VDPVQTNRERFTPGVSFESSGFRFGRTYANHVRLTIVCKVGEELSRATKVDAFQISIIDSFDPDCFDLRVFLRLRKLPFLLKSIREISETAITAVLIFVVLQISTQSFRVDGRSMEPTMADGQHVLVNKFVYASAADGLFGDILHTIKGDDGGRSYLFHAPQRDDVIVFTPPTGPNADFLVKRVIGIPGDEIDIRGGQVWVNGEPRDENFPLTKVNGGTYPLSVEADMLFVLGDNRGRSNDSRTWGQLPAENVVGRVWFGYWPPPLMKLYSTVSSGLSPTALSNLFR